MYNIYMLQIIYVILLFQFISSINYPGGWIFDSNKTKCVNICNHSINKPTCFNNNDIKCLHKKQEPGDYDYLILEQLYLPIYCTLLDNGIDLTLSHQSVNKYPNGIQCNKNRILSKLFIHGLWPQYYGGYPSCCHISLNNTNIPYLPKILYKKYNNILNKMKKEDWIDPTQINNYNSLCELYNHEFQKHGLCFIPFNRTSNNNINIEKLASIYFSAGLNLKNIINKQTKEINKWAETIDSIPFINITNLYSKNIKLYCKNNYLVSIQTCWNKYNILNKNSTMIDCPNDFNKSNRIINDNDIQLCNNSHFNINFYKYISPSLLFNINIQIYQDEDLIIS